jgi:hypothetical protein
MHDALHDDSIAVFDPIEKRSVSLQRTLFLQVLVGMLKGATPEQTLFLSQLLPRPAKRTTLSRYYRTIGHIIEYAGEAFLCEERVKFACGLGIGDDFEPEKWSAACDTVSPVLHRLVLMTLSLLFRAGHIGITGHSTR